MELVFVYNADSGLFNSLRDLALKALAPESQECPLCAVTISPFGMRREWRRFVSNLNYPVVFLHRDEMPALCEGACAELPAAFISNGVCLVPWISAEDLKQCDSLNDLKVLVQRRLCESC